MNRQMVYAGQVLPETTLLNMTKDSMIGMAKLAAAVLGTNTLVNGLACSPTSPASMQVSVAQGEIYSLQNVDNTAFSSLPADTVDQILKQGLSMSPTLLSCPAPATAGQTINYLVQVCYQDVDANATVLPYYNASNPSQAYSGSGNSGAAQATVRQGVCQVVIKVGVAATSGTQVTPSPDPSYIGLYVVSVPNGTTSITSANISLYSGAPFLTESLTQKISQATADGRYATQAVVQQNSLCVANAGGTADAITGTYTPAITALTNGMALAVRASAPNATTTPTFTPAPGVIAALPIVKGAGSPLVAGDIAGAGHWIELNYDATLNKWVLLNPVGAAGLAWQSVKSASFTAAQNCAYPINSSASSFTVTLPATPTPSLPVVLLDYARTFGTNNITVNPNGSLMNGVSGNITLSSNGESVWLVYIDSTQGWVAYSGFTKSPIQTAVPVSYLISGGGGGGGGSIGGGGAGGGVLIGTATLTVGTIYTVTVGAGGAGGAPGANGTNGGNSSISGVGTALGGGGGGGTNGNNGIAGSAGGSGGGGAGGQTLLGGVSGTGGAGTSGQGNAGGTGAAGTSTGLGGGGGGAGSVGAIGSGTTAGAGGSGVSSSITGAATVYGPGGGGGAQSGVGGAGGAGGGGAGSASGAGTAGTANTGGGGGGSAQSQAGANGGSGVGVLSIPTSLFSGVVTGSPTVGVVGLNTVMVFKNSGTYTA